MVNLNTTKINHNVLLATLCALITLVPVVNFALTVPGELVLTLGAWVISNGLISTLLFLYSRMNRPVAVRA